MRVSVLFFLLPLLLPVVSPVHAAGDPDNGARLTRTWCSGCHAAGASGADVAPPLREIASRSGRTDAFLYVWLTDPHPPMPRLDLSNREIADVMAHLARLRSAAAK